MIALALIFPIVSITLLIYLSKIAEAHQQEKKKIESKYKQQISKLKQSKKTKTVDTRQKDIEKLAKILNKSHQEVAEMVANGKIKL